MKLSAFSLFRPLVAGFLWLALGLTVARAQSSLPNAQVGQAYSFTVTTTPAAPSGTTYAATGLPLGVSINASSGVISGTPTTAGTATGSVSLTSSGVTNSFTYTLLVNPAAGTPAITNATLTISATAGTPIAGYTVTASNSPTSFNVGALPAGLTFTSPTISGTPTTAGTYTVALSANNGIGAGAASTLTITVAAAGPVPAITNSPTSITASLNVAFSYQLTASPAAVSYSAAPLPLGLSLDSTTGLITGTPTVGGQTTIAVRATNNNGTGPITNLTLSLGALPLITSAATTTGTVGSNFNFTVTASNPPIGGFTITNLPPGLSANAGVISGVPTTAGVYTLSASATNITGTGPSSTLTITISAPSGGGGGGGGGFPATAPIITASPVALTVAVGDSATFQVFAAGTGTLTYQWRKNGTAITGATLSTYTIVSAQAADVASYDVVVTNSVGSSTSAAATLTVSGILTPPVIATQPASQTLAAGATATFTVTVTANPAPTYQWRKDGAAITGATAASLTLANITAASAGSYTVVATNSQGSATSSGATLTVTSSTAPAISTQPVAQTGGVGGSVTFTAAATGGGALTYQWKKDGVAIPGATAATLTLTNLQGADSGVYTVTVTNSAGSVTSDAATLTVPASRLANVSVRSGAGTGDQTLIVGLAVGGTGSKQILIRGVGPGLTQFGVPGALADPQLRLFSAAGVQTNVNDDWGGGATLAAAFSAVGAFALPATSKDAALLLPLATGSYTAQVTATSGTGIAILEAYDSDAAATSSRLVNISARTQVGTGDSILVVGFVITGTGSKNVLLRAVGPGLTQFGVGGVLADPQLRLFNAGGAQIGLNDDWAGSAALAASFAQTGAFALPATSKDAALLVALPPGAYTAQVSGVANTTGVALVEVYEAP